MIFGHRRQIAYLKKVFEKKTAAHAYLFSGPEGVGKRTVALEWVKLFFCQAVIPKKTEACGVCASCRAVASGSHPDVVMLSPDHPLVGEEKKEIGIDNIRELKRLASLTSYSGGRRFFVIDGAEFLPEVSQNAFLKLLEEPSGGAVFVLIAESAGMLLPTIVSRVVPITFYPPSEESMGEMVEGEGNGKVAAAEKSLLISLAAGRPGFVARALHDRTFFEDEKKEYDSVLRLIEDGVAAQLVAGEALAKDRDAFRSFADRLTAILHERLKHDPDPEQSRMLGSVIDIRFAALHTNASPRLAVDAMFLSMNI